MTNPPVEAFGAVGKPRVSTRACLQRRRAPWGLTLPTQASGVLSAGPVPAACAAPHGALPRFSLYSSTVDLALAPPPQ